MSMKKRLAALLMLGACWLMLSGCMVTTYTSGYDYNYTPPPGVQHREFMESGTERPTIYRPVFW